LKWLLTFKGPKLTDRPDGKISSTAIKPYDGLLNVHNLKKSLQ